MKYQWTMKSRKDSLIQMESFQILLEMWLLLTVTMSLKIYRNQLITKFKS